MPSLLLHGAEVIRNLNIEPGGGPHGVQTDILVYLGEDHLSVPLLENPHLSDDHVHALLARQRQAAVL